MSTLIRDAKFGKQPLVLERVRSAVLANPNNVIGNAIINSINPLAARPDHLPSEARHNPHVEIDESGVITVYTAPKTIATPVVPMPVPTYEDHERTLGEKLERMKQEASERGYAEGLQAVQDKVQAEYAAEIEGLRALILSARSAMDQQLDGIMDAAAEIVFEAVAKIIGHVCAEQEGIVAVVREVVHHAKERSRLVIRVNPGDLEVVRACAADIASGTSAGNVDIVPDDRVVLGGCLLETPAGTLDGRLEIQLQQLRDTLIHARLRHADRIIES